MSDELPEPLSPKSILNEIYVILLLSLGSLMIDYVLSFFEDVPIHLLLVIFFLKWALVPYAAVHFLRALFFATKYAFFLLESVVEARIFGITVRFLRTMMTEGGKVFIFMSHISGFLTKVLVAIGAIFLFLNILGGYFDGEIFALGINRFRENDDDDFYRGIEPVVFFILLFMALLAGMIFLILRVAQRRRALKS